MVGQNSLKEHDLRYAQAEEFLELCYKFWEGSWQDDAIVKDKARRTFTEPSKVHAIEHQGQFYQSQGVFQVAPSIQRTPVLYQAGASARGLSFATQHAEALFIGGDSIEKARQQVNKIRALAKAQGRHAEDIKIFVGITVITAATDQLAQEKFAEYLRYASPEAGLAHFSSSVGIDLSRYTHDEAIPYQQTNSIASVNQRFKEQKITIADLKEQHALGGRYPIFIGSGSTIAQQLIDYVDQSGIDGFNLTRTVAPESHEDFIRYVIPELQQRRRYKTSYTAGSLRHKLTGKGDRLPEQHPVSAFRCRPSSSANKQSA